MKLIALLLCSVGLAFPAFADAGPADYQVRFDTNRGIIILQLDAASAPETVSNFLAYVRSGFYNGTIFHRVISGFMIQGGGFSADFKRKPTREAIKNEADNGLKNLRGAIAMARTGDPHSATAQFFINLVDNTYLDHRNKTAKGWGYCVFGKVIRGMAVVDAIAKSPTTVRGGMRDVPIDAIIIQQAAVLPQASQ